MVRTGNGSFAFISSALIYPATGPDYVEKTTEAAVAKAISEMKAVSTCKRQVEGRTISLRFVKCEDIDTRAKYNDISSTIVRNFMNKQKK